MGSCCSSLCKSWMGDTNITLNVTSRNENNNTVDKKDRKGQPRQSKSDEESNVKSDQESRSYIIKEEKNDPNVSIKQTSSGQESKKNNSPIPGKEGLALQSTEFYMDKIGMSP